MGVLRTIGGGVCSSREEEGTTYKVSRFAEARTWIAGGDVVLCQRKYGSASSRRRL